jgi:DNA polymerase III delta prime subunit
LFDVLHVHLIALMVVCSMTGGAQQALRRTMEIHSSTTRFALACNQSSKIIEPIQSRCAIVRFLKLSNEEVLKQVKWVAGKENVAYDDSGLEAITFTADGDMRQALNNLQATSAGFGFVNQVRLGMRACVCVQMKHDDVTFVAYRSAANHSITPKAVWSVSQLSQISSCCYFYVPTDVS